MTRRRWIADAWNEDSAVLRGRTAAHLARVLRAQIGQTFDIVAGGIVRRGTIERVGPDTVEFSLHEEILSTISLPLNIGLSLIRFDRLEWAIEKLTELGVAKVTPLAAQRSEKRLVAAAAKRVERWRRIAHDSAQQSRRADTMGIADPIPVTRWLDEAEPGTHLFFSEQEQSATLRQYLENSGDLKNTVSVAIGPEGGWSPAEVERFAHHEWRSLTLGPRILRSETAAITVASTLNLWMQG